MELDATKFEESCRETLLTFLSGYKSQFEYFNKKRLSKARGLDERLFQSQSNEASHVLFVRWFLDVGKVLVVGLVQDVERKLAEIVDYLEKLVPRWVHFFVNLHFRW